MVYLNKTFGYAHDDNMKFCPPLESSERFQRIGAEVE